MLLGDLIRGDFDINCNYCVFKQYEEDRCFGNSLYSNMSYHGEPLNAILDKEVVYMTIDETPRGTNYLIIEIAE